MFSKKLAVVLVAVGVVASTSTLFNQVNIKGAFADNIKQNVVYNKDDNSSASKDGSEVTGAEEEAYKNKSIDILKNYFNISVEENEDFKFSACILNEKTLDEIETREKNLVQEAYDKKEISKDEYDKRMTGIEENNSGLKERVEKLKHGMVQTGWTNEDKCYMFDFNENTKEVDFAFVSEGKNDKSDAIVKLSEDQAKGIAEDFIKKNKIGEIENPKCILVERKHFLYFQDENDASKKAYIVIDPFTGKVDMFGVGTYAEIQYNEAVNRK